MSLESNIKQKEPLSSLTTFKIGGQAEFFISLKEKEELVEAVRWAEKNKLKLNILAGGSNVLISDGLIRGLTLKMDNKNIVLRGDRIECESGVELSKAVSLSLSAGFSGLEWALGIPGSVGGAARGNAGAFGGSISESVETAEVFDLKRKKYLFLSRADLRFGYRHSLIKDKDNYLIWGLVMKMRRSSRLQIKELAESYLEKRIKSQPRLPSAGCVFKNLSLEEVENSNRPLAKLAQQQGVAKKGLISAGWIIDQAGLSGKKIGEAKISLEHANFIVNTGQATAEHVVMLISLVKQKVRNNLKIQLSEEIQYFGF